MKQFNRSIIYVLTFIMLFSSLNLTSKTAFAEAIQDTSGDSFATKQPDSSGETKQKELSRKFSISIEDIQATLDQGYSMEDVSKALEDQKVNGGTFGSSLNKVKPHPVNTSMDARSTITSGVAETSLAVPMSTLAAVPDYSFVKTKPDEAPFTIQLDNETISTLSGGLSLRQSDLVLPGRNGLGFTLSRRYDSGSAQFDQMVTIGGVNATQQPLDEKRFPIGKGWNWDISFLEINESGKFLHLAGSGVFKIDDTNTLVGYPWKDVAFSPDSSVTVNGVVSAYAVKSIQKNDQYFNADGQLIQISDAYNNKVTFAYTNNSTYGSVLSTITDAIGNTINITYNTTSVVLTAGTRTVTYYKAVQNGKELLSQVVDELGRATTYDYSIQSAQFNLLGTTPNTNNPYALITGVTYPTGAKTVYTYENTPITRYIDTNAVNQVYRVKSREDQVTLSDSSLEHDNHKDITYPSGDIGSSYATDMTFSIAINNGLSTTTFSNEKDYIDATTSPVFYNTSIISTAAYGGKTYTKTTEYTYDRARKWPVPINTKITQSNSGTASTLVTTSSAMYDDYANIVTTTDPLGTLTNYTFDSTTHLLMTVAKQVNGTQQWLYTQYTRNTLGKVIKEQVFTGTSTGSTGNPLRETNYENIDPTTGNVMQVRTKNGTANDTTTAIEYAATYQYAFPTKTTTSIHDVDGNASTIIKQYQYNMATGKLSQYTDGNSNVTAYAYDASGRATKATQQADGSSISIEYNDFLNQITQTDQTGIKTVTNWNPLGWQSNTGIMDKNVYKAKTKNGYDTNGRLVWTEDAVGNRTNYGYDQWSRQTSISYPDGGPNSSIVMDDIANTKTSSNPEGYISKTYLDKLGRTLKTEETKVGKQPTLLMTYTYDNAGNMLTAKDNVTQSNTTTYTYDVLNQLTSVTNLLNGVSQTTSYSYDLLGDTTTITFPGSSQTSKKYDEVGRLIQNTEAAVNGKNNIDQYYFDGNGNQIKLKDRNGSRFKYTYDGRNFLKKKEIVDASWNPITGEETISFGYDLAGRRTSMSDQTGTTSYAYSSSAGMLATVTYPDAKKMTYDYDDNGNRRALTDAFGANLYYQYDARNRLTAVGSSVDLSTDYDAQYQYNHDNLLQQIKQRNGVTSVFTYDGMNLSTLIEKKADQTILNSFSYTYDNNRNISTKVENGNNYSFQYDELNRIKTSSQYNETYTYDNRGNRASMSTNHPFERLDATTTFDKRDRLSSVATASGNTVTYKYNGDGLLWERTENTQTTRYYWDGDQIEAEASVSGGVATFKARYIRGQSLIAREDAQGKAYYVQNGHGDITDVMDKSGMTRLNQYSYDIFGNIASQIETNMQPFKYSGELQDDAAGLQYLRARWYDPSIGRFIGEDAYKGQVTNPLTLNLYTYVLNNPLIYSDPTGHHISLDDTLLSKDDNDAIKGLTSQFMDAQGQGNISRMQYLHDQANAIRAASGKYDIVYRTDYATGKVTALPRTAGGVKEDYLTEAAAVPVIAAAGLNAAAIFTAGAAAIDVATIGTAIPTYYQVTSYAAAEIIMKTGVLKGSQQEAGNVFVWTTQPTLAQAKNSGARALDVVLEFQIPTGVTGVDTTLAPDLQKIGRFVNGPVNITNVKVVGFK